MWNPSTRDCEFNKSNINHEYIGIQNCSCEKRLNGKIVWEYEDKMLNTTKMLLMIKG